MRRIRTLSHLMSYLPSRWREARADAPGRARESHSEAFRAQTFPHVDAIYTDAFCLTGSREEAIDLVVEAYSRAYLGYSEFRQAAPRGEPKQWEALAWLYRNLHAAFCDRVLAHTPPRETSLGGYS